MPYTLGHNDPRAKEGRKRWRAANPEKVREMRDRSYARHRERRLEDMRIRREAHREEARAATRQWQKDNPDRVALHGQARRARKLAAFVEYVHPLVVLERADGECGICGGDVSPFDFEVDHIVPLSRGGLHNYENTQPAHKVCNRRKSDSLPEEIAA